MENGRLMLRSLLVAAAVLVASIPVAAQQQLWSATMTAGEIVYMTGTTAIGYFDVTPIFGSSSIKAGELSDIDFDFRGTTYTIWYFYQEDNGEITLAFSPPLDEQDMDSLTFTADDHSLAVSDRKAVIAQGSGRGVQIYWPDPGFRWTVGQRIAVGLTATTPTPVPALPLAGVGLLGVLLALLGCRQRTRGRSPESPGVCSEASAGAVQTP